MSTVETIGRSRRRRGVAVVIFTFALVVVVPFFGLSALALTSAYASVVVPPSCAQAVAVPPDRTIDLPGRGSGVRLADSGDRTLAISMSSSPSPRPLAAHMIDRSTFQVLWETTLASDVVVAAFDGGLVFVWDDKLGYAIDAATGDPLGALVRSDNYRGTFMIGDSRHLQLDAEVTSIGLGGSIFSHQAFNLAGVVDGCTFGLPGD
jgi:hypothetical protein